MPETAVEPEIQSERDYQTAARAALHRMHSDVVNTETQLFAAGGFDPTILNQMVTGAREQRAKALVDLPDVPLFFGRLDYDPGTVFAESSDVDRVYIGRRHVEDGGTPLVDRLAGAHLGGVLPGHPHRSAGRADAPPLRFLRGRRSSPRTRTSRCSARPKRRPARCSPPNSTGPRSGPMRDIVATIQPGAGRSGPGPAARHALRAGRAGHRKDRGRPAPRRLPALCRAGSAGPQRCRRGRPEPLIPLIHPARAADPRRGQRGQQTTFEQLVGRVPANDAEQPEIARIKGDGRMAAVLHRALWRHVDRPTEGLMYVEGSFRYRIADYEVREIIASLRGTMRYVPGRAAAAATARPRRTGPDGAAGQSLDDRTQNAVARSRPVKQVLDAVWPKVTPEQVLFRLFSDAEFLAEAGEAPLRRRAGPVDVAEAVPILEVREMVSRRLRAA